MSKTRQLGIWQVFCICSGAMVSSGLFILPGLAHAVAGPAVVLSYLLAGLLALSGMLTVAEIVTAMPKAGGDYYFITRTMGPGIGTAAGLLSWFSLTLKSAFALVGMAGFFAAVGIQQSQLASVLICVAFVGVNLVGTHKTGVLQVVLVMGMLALMLLYVIQGLGQVESRFLLPFAPYGWNAVFTTTGLVFISYGGLLKIASVAEDIDNPGRTIPAGMISSLLVITAFYVAMVFVTTGVLPSAVLDHSLTPISDGAAAFMGRAGVAAMSGAAVLAFLSTANAGILSASQYLFSLGRDQLLPPLFGHRNRRFNTPDVAVLITGVVAIGALFVQLESLVKAASTVLIITYLAANVCLLILRESRLANYRPRFHAPLYPYLQVLGIVGYLFVLVEMGWEALGTSALLVAAGLLLYLVYGRLGARREYALLHLVERLSNREFTSGALEAELKQIIRDRDDLCYDRFDRIVERAPVLDLDGGTTAAELFRQVSEAAKERFGIDAERLCATLLRVNTEHSSLIHPGHAVLAVESDGDQVQMVLARIRQGLTLTAGDGAVHTLFVLLVPPSDQAFHLQALASIAQILRDHDFDRGWFEAHTEQQLRDLVLLGDRRRMCLL